jgi:hypothetical protein
MLIRILYIYLSLLIAVTKNVSDWILRPRIIGFLEFVHRPEFQIIINHEIRKLELGPSSGELGKDKTPNRVAD